VKAARILVPRIEHRRWGYLVWVIALGVIGVPEIIAAKWSHWLPFTTISAMTGHLERHHNWVELLVVAVIVFVILSTVRVRPEPKTIEPTEQHPGRTAGGRLTVKQSSEAVADGRRDTPAEADAIHFDDDYAPGIFFLAAVAACTAVAAATYAATRAWDDPPQHYQPAYVLYGTLAVLWLIIPSLVAFTWGKDPPYPTLFRTIINLEDWFKNRRWQIKDRLVGPYLAWLIGFVVLWGLVVLLLHLTLYPYPDITDILNPNG
jgi:hypothetical protein